MLEAAFNVEFDLVREKSFFEGGGFDINAKYINAKYIEEIMGLATLMQLDLWYWSNDASCCGVWRSR